MPRLPAVLPLILLAVIAAPGAVRADLDGLPPTYRERMLLWKMVLTKDQDDPNFGLFDGNTELLMRVGTHHSGHDVVYWDLIDQGLDMDSPVDTAYVVVDGEQPDSTARRQLAEVFLHLQCGDAGKPAVRVTAWESDEDHVGQFLMKLGDAVGFAGQAFPQAAAIGAAARVIGKIIDVLGNGATLLGSGSHGLESDTRGALYDYVEPGVTGWFAPSGNFRYKLSWEREVVDSANCIPGPPIAFARSRLERPDITPAEHNYMSLVSLGWDELHAVTKGRLSAIPHWAALGSALYELETTTPEPGTSPLWKTRRRGALAYDYGLLRGPGAELYQLSQFYLDLGPALTLEKREGECWASIPEDTMFIPEPAADAVWAGGVGPAGNVHLAGYSYGNGDCQSKIFDLERTGSSMSTSAVDHARVSSTWSMSVVDSGLCMDSNDPSQKALAVAVGRDGTPWVAYVGLGSQGNPTLWCATRGPGGWTHAAVDTLGQIGKWLSIAVDSLGRPHIGYSVSTLYSWLRDEPRAPNICHAVRDSGFWKVDSVAIHWSSLGPLPCAMALDSHARPHFAFIEVGGPSFKLKYAGPGTVGGSPEIVSNNYLPSVGGFSIAMDPADEPRVLFMRHDFARASTPNLLVHSHRHAVGGWIESVVDSQSTFFAVAKLAVDSSGRSNVLYDDEDVGEFQGLRFDLMHAVESLPGGSSQPTNARAARRRERFASAAAADSAGCTWKTEVKELLVQLGRDPLVTEIGEALADTVSPSLAVLSQEDLATGDALLASKDYSGALAVYQQGFMRLVEGNHPENVTASVAPPIVPASVKLLSIRSAERSGVFRFTLFTPVRQRINVELFDVLGRRAGVLVDRDLEAGAHRLEWDSSSSARGSIPSGIYFARLAAASGTDKAMVVLLR